MKKRTACLGYTKICQRMWDHLRKAGTTPEMAAQIFAFIRSSKADGLARHEAANRRGVGMSAMEHSIRKSSVEFEQNYADDGVIKD